MQYHSGGASASVGSNTPRREPIEVVPAPEVWACVKFADAPDAPPDELVPYAVRSPTTDWALTDDVLAFGEPGVIEQFTSWRNSWERTWVLDPITNVERLFDLAHSIDETYASMETFERARLAARKAGVRDVDLTVAELAGCLRDLRRLREIVQHRDAHGYGVVDLTPNTRRVGLARSWPSWGEAEVVAAAEGVVLTLDPSTGLYLSVADGDLAATGAGATTSVGPIEHVAAEGDVWTISGDRTAVTVSRARARALGWLVPGATDWRIRRIPEIVAWARSFASLEECLEFAAAESLPVRLTTRRPIADISIDAAPT